MQSQEGDYWYGPPLNINVTNRESVTTLYSSHVAVSYGLSINRLRRDASCWLTPLSVKIGNSCLEDCIVLRWLFYFERPGSSILFVGNQDHDMNTDLETELFLRGRNIAFVGKLGGMNRREASQLVRRHGGISVELSNPDVDLVVIGADELLLDEDLLLESTVREAAAEGRLEIIGETDLWQRLGFIDDDIDWDVRRLYTPAMLAGLLNVPVSVIRRWHRRGLIVPAREVQQLPYFDFQEVSTARHLTQLVASGASPLMIEKKLGQLARFVNDAERPLAQLGVIIQGRDILLRQGEGLIESGGQLRIDFEAFDQSTANEITRKMTPPQTILSFDEFVNEASTVQEMIESAVTWEERGEFGAAACLYRSALAAGGPQADICFRLAEVLFLDGKIEAALERYYMVIELDETFVEARANLGCVLVEMDDLPLAVAAFRGALTCHPDYPDVHYHLARALDELDEHTEANVHWDTFLDLAPDSPWADEARLRLGTD